MMNERRIIILFVKYPQQGRVKTRLARTVGDEEAVLIYRSLVTHLIGMLRETDADELCVSFDPVDKRAEVEAWIGGLWSAEKGGALATRPALTFRAQCEGDLGERMETTFSEIFQQHEGAEMPAPFIVAMGSDCIELDGQTLQAAWQALRAKDVVFGPTVDGGYYLLAMKALQSVLFQDIPWSMEDTLEVSLQRCRDAGLQVELLDEKHDIDTEEDWQQQQGFIVG